MPHTAVNHARGEVVSGETEDQFQEEARFCATNHVEARSSATERWERRKDGAEIRILGERSPYVSEFQRIRWVDEPYAPRLVDTVDARGRGIHEARLEAGATETRVFRTLDVIDLLDSDGEF